MGPISLRSFVFTNLFLDSFRKQFFLNTTSSYRTVADEPIRVSRYSTYIYIYIYIARFFTYRDHIPSSLEDIRFAFARAAGLFVPRSFYYVCLRRCHKKAKRPTIFSIERGSYRGTLKGPG